MAGLQRKLTLYGLTMIAVGSCIGAGIFITPYKIVQALPHNGYVLLVWGLGGLIALTGALTFAELGAMFPRAGGVYVFLREGYGNLTGFLYGWVTLLVINTGSLAALAIILAEYLTFFFPITDGGKVLLAMGVITGLTLVNIRGVGVSQWLSNVFTGLKLLAIAGIVVLGIVYYDPARVELSFSLTRDVPDHLPNALLLALIGVLWSFGGWHHASYMAGEAINPQRTVPRAMMLGALVVTVTYLLVNLGYMLLLPLEAIQQSTRIAGDAAQAVLSNGGQLAALVIAVSVFGTIGIYTMSAPRIYFAMARDGVFFEQLARVHPRYHTPATAMIIQSLWAMLLLLFWGSFENLISYVTFMDIAFMALAGFVVVMYRVKRPEIARPYKVWGYPVVPLVFIGISAAFTVSTLIQQPVQALAGLGLLALGIFVYFGVKKGGVDANPGEY